MSRAGIPLHASFTVDVGVDSVLYQATYTTHTRNIIQSFCVHSTGCQGQAEPTVVADQRGPKRGSIKADSLADVTQTYHAVTVKVSL